MRLACVGKLGYVARMVRFRSVDPKQSFPALEERVLQFWKDHKIFEKSLEQTQGNKTFVFYEGPPTANGQPGIHHVLARSFKDVIPRYKTMQGYHVPRKAGWDCHGLPVEVQVEKKLGYTGKKQIEADIRQFTQQCRESVSHYIVDWNKLTERIGYWVDEDHAYKTMDNAYIESCWSLLGKLHEKDLLRRDYKTTKHCPRCETSLSEAEAGQGMKEVEDPAITVLFPLVEGTTFPGRTPEGKLITATPEEPIYLLIWTTTPWTLPANCAVAVHPDATYELCEWKYKDKTYRGIVMEERRHAILGANVKVLDYTEGKKLEELLYQPPYDLMRELNVGKEKQLSSGNVFASERSLTGFVILADKEVTKEDGTGLVHIAPLYGDLELSKRHSKKVRLSGDYRLYPVEEGELPIQPFHILDSGGNFLGNVPYREAHSHGELPLKGKFFKDADDEVIRNLRERELLFKKEQVKHNYPFCWRCDSPLSYYAKHSWYILTSTKKSELLEANQKIDWIPEHIQEGRFGDWLRNNVDWAISRERYWGTPLPLWQCPQNHQEWVWNLNDLTQKPELQHKGNPYVLDPTEVRQGKRLDLHRPDIDEITWKCEKCSGRMTRVKDVLDCWFDSGAMPYAQNAYLFSQHADTKPPLFPADFISEGVDQTRGWFYTLHALSVLSLGEPAFTHCIVLGHILDEQGRKMSKKLGNIVDPWTVLNKEGADALRYCLYTASPAGHPRRFSQALVQQGLRQFLLTLWNCYSFFVTYAETEYHKLGATVIPWQERPVMDQWILGQLHRLIQQVTERLDAYDITQALRSIADFVDELSNWYVRRNRGRFWSSLEGPEGAVGTSNEQDKRAAYHTLLECLATASQLAAPFVPFVTEEIWQNLQEAWAAVQGKPSLSESVHLSAWPVANQTLVAATESLTEDMKWVLQTVSLGRTARVESSIKVRQPLSLVRIQVPHLLVQQSLQRFEREILEELNVHHIEWVDAKVPLVQYKIKPNLPVIGKKYGPLIKSIQAALAAADLQRAQDWAQALLHQQPIELHLGDRALALGPEEVLLQSEANAGLAVQAKEGLVVALQTEITPTLWEQGIAREIVRAVGELRKQAQCKVNDRVFVRYQVHQPEIRAALHNQGPWIAQETLSTWEEGIYQPAHVESQVVLDEGVVTLMLHR